MEVIAALEQRRSIRAFEPTEVEPEKLAAILAAAVNTPSWANSQPWEVFVASGDAVSRIRAAYAECYKNGVKSTPDIARPAQWTEANKARQQGLRPDMVRDCGDDVANFGALNQAMFNAPAVIYLCVDKLLAHWALYDIGAFSQSIMLLAAERGLGTIPAITLVMYPEVLRRELGIPDNLNVAIGIAIGYTDESRGINNFVSARSPLSESVRFVD